MALNNVYGTDNARGNTLKEDVSDMIADLYTKDTYLYDNLQGAKATQPLHQFLSYTASRASSQEAVAEGADTTYTDLTSSVRRTNYVQNIEKGFQVSEVQIESDNYGISNQFEFEKAKAMEQWKFQAEYSLLKGTGVTNESGTAAQMAGLENVISSNVYSVASGTTLTETEFNNALELLWNDVSDDKVVVLTNIRLKRAMSGFSASDRYTVNTPMEARKLDSVIEVYRSDAAGMVEMHAHRDMGVTDNKFVAFQPRAYAKASLIPARFEDRAKTGASRKGAIFGALTLEYRYEQAGVIGTGFIAGF